MFVTRFTRHAFITVAVVTTAVLAWSCERGSEKTAPPALATPEPVPTLAADPFGVPLVRQDSATGLYTLELPEGWQRAEMTGAAAEETFDFYAGERLVSQIAVTCEPIPVVEGRRWSVDDFIERDVFYARQFGGGEAVDRAPVTVQNLRGEVITYATSLGTVPIVQRAAYLAAEECMWIVRLRVFGTGDPSPYLLLFNRVLASFRPLAGASGAPLPDEGS